MDLEATRTLFANLRENTDWDINGPLLWGYFFVHASAEPLQALTPALILRVAPELGQHAGMASATAQEPDVVTAAPDDAQIQAVLRRYRGNRAAAARHLGMSRTTLWRRLKQLSDEVDEAQQ